VLLTIPGALLNSNGVAGNPTGQERNRMVIELRREAAIASIWFTLWGVLCSFRALQYCLWECIVIMTRGFEIWSYVSYVRLFEKEKFRMFIYFRCLIHVSDLNLLFKIRGVTVWYQSVRCIFGDVSILSEWWPVCSGSPSCALRYWLSHWVCVSVGSCLGR
jgi:hypothetical protein